MVRIRISKKWAITPLVLISILMSQNVFADPPEDPPVLPPLSAINPSQGAQAPVNTTTNSNWTWDFSGANANLPKVPENGNGPVYYCTGAGSCASTSNNSQVNINGDNNNVNVDQKAATGENLKELGTGADCSSFENAVTKKRMSPEYMTAQSAMDQCATEYKEMAAQNKVAKKAARQISSQEKMTSTNVEDIESGDTSLAPPAPNVPKTPSKKEYVCQAGTGAGKTLAALELEFKPHAEELKKVEDAANSCSKVHYSKHDCSKSVLLDYLKGKCKDKQSQEDIEVCRNKELTALNQNQEERSRLEDKYNCKATSEYLDGLGSYSAMVGTVTTTIGMAAAATASRNVAGVAGSGGNVMQSAYSEMSKANNKAANTQFAMAGADLLVAGYAKIRARKHKNAIEDVNRAKDAGRILSDSSEDKDGSEMVQEQVDAHQALVDRANQIATQSTVNAAMGAINGLAMKSAAKQNQQIQNELNLPPSIPQQMGYQGTGPGMNFGGGPQGTAANAFEQQANAASDGGTKDDTAPNAGGLSFGSAPGSAPTSGGLKGPSPGANNSMVAMSGGGGGPAGGGGGGSGGGAGGSSGEAAETNEDAGSVPGLKYESGAGGGFASNAANKHRMNDTGEMSGIGALLEKFLPKKEEEDNKQGNILSFTQKGGERSLASVEEDGSILGPNSNLFSRVSNSMMANLKKGNLK